MFMSECPPPEPVSTESDRSLLSEERPLSGPKCNTLVALSEAELAFVESVVRVSRPVSWHLVKRLLVEVRRWRGKANGS